MNVSKRTVRSTSLIGICLATGFLASLEVNALEAEEGSVLEEVIITGSRIRQDPLDERLPVLTLDSVDYRATGASPR